jgi:hypothetical protein
MSKPSKSSETHDPWQTDLSQLSSRSRLFLIKVIALGTATVVLLGSQALVAEDDWRKDQGRYLPGDFHNHTTFSDGSTSARTLIDKSVGEYSLDWFAQSGHGGSQSRDGRVDDLSDDGDCTGGPKVYWEDTIGSDAILGDDITATVKDCEGKDRKIQQMWKWQAVQEFLYPITYQAYKDYGKPIWMGVEWHVPGHEHCSTGIITGQFPVSRKIGNANAMAQFEYLFDYKDNDTSEGGGQGWTGKITNITNATDAGSVMHAKAVQAATWMQQYHPLTSYLVPAHIERKGKFNKDKAYDTGYNIEHFRDLNNAAPTVAFGFEGQPGHQADPDRGGFGSGAFGEGTYGGTGYYSATIGHIWDALLGEGRNWWIFASSDWHSRDTAEYNNDADRENALQSTKSANDFWPGEYQKDYVFVDGHGKPTARDVLRGMRSGNSYIVMGDLITELEFTAQVGFKKATMGETLYVKPGAKVVIKVKVKDPQGSNHCPYIFNNPSLAQLDIHQPLNQPVLHHVDLISGDVYGKISPTDTAKYQDLTNKTAKVVKQVMTTEMAGGDKGWRSFTYEYEAKQSSYFRLRGTNLPPGTPNETDEEGNPLLDTKATENIKYKDPDTKEEVALDKDVEAWADLWFYSNPIFVYVR